jgi:hypothetical protein
LILDKLTEREREREERRNHKTLDVEERRTKTRRKPPCIIIK